MTSGCNCRILIYLNQTQSSSKNNFALIVYLDSITEFKSLKEIKVQYKVNYSLNKHLHYILLTRTVAIYTTYTLSGLHFFKIFSGFGQPKILKQYKLLWFICLLI